MTNARVAGFTFLLYIAAGIASMALAQTPSAELLSLLTSFCALVLGVTLYAITREHGPEIAMMGLACRVVEAVPGEGTIFFAVGSALFSWLLLRGRLIPVWMAWLGVVASVLLAVVLAMQRAGLLGGPTGWGASATWFVWLPMLVFEVAIALWFLVKGVATSRATSSA